MDELRTVARPYAKAVFDVAISSGALTEWSEFLKHCSSLLENSEIKALIKTPGLNKKTVAEVFYDSAMLKFEKGNPNKKQFLNLIQTLSSNGRLNVMKELQKQYDQKKESQKKQPRLC